MAGRGAPRTTRAGPDADGLAARAETTGPSQREWRRSRLTDLATPPAPGPGRSAPRRRSSTPRQRPRRLPAAARWATGSTPLRGNPRGAGRTPPEAAGACFASNPGRRGRRGRGAGGPRRPRRAADRAHPGPARRSAGPGAAPRGRVLQAAGQRRALSPPVAVGAVRRRPAGGDARGRHRPAPHPPGGVRRHGALTSVASPMPSNRTQPGSSRIDDSASAVMAAGNAARTPRRPAAALPEALVQGEPIRPRHCRPSGRRIAARSHFSSTRSLMLRWPPRSPSETYRTARETSWPTERR